MNRQQQKLGNYFMVPNAIFYLELHQTSVSVYAYLMHIEDRRTYQCIASYSTIADALGIAPNTVAKYVRQLEEKGLIHTERTEVITRDGVNATAVSGIPFCRSSAPSISTTRGRWMSWFGLPHSREPRQRRSNWVSTLSRRLVSRAHDCTVSAPVGRCVRPFGAGWRPELKSKFEPLRPTSANRQYVQTYPTRMAEPTGRKRCRIKRWHHRGSHRPAMRVGDGEKLRVCGDWISRFVDYDMASLFARRCRI